MTDSPPPNGHEPDPSPDDPQHAGETTDHPPTGGASDPDPSAQSAAIAVNDKELSLEELESQIRDQLKSVITDAKSTRERTNDLLTRAEPLRKVRDSLVSILDGEREDFQELVSQHRTVIDKRVKRIHKVAGRLKGNIDLRADAVAASQLTWANLRETELAGAEQWRDAVIARREALSQQLAKLDQEITRLEARWGDPDDVQQPPESPTR